MTIAISRRLREGHARSIINAAERIALAEIDRDPHVAALLARRAAADARHRQEAAKNAARLAVVAQAKERLAQAEREIARLEAAFPALAYRFAAGEASDGDIGAHTRAVQSWQQKAQALRVGTGRMEKETADVVRATGHLGDAVGDLDSEIEETRALVALELARRAA